MVAMQRSGEQRQLAVAALLLPNDLDDNRSGVQDGCAVDIDIEKNTVIVDSTRRSSRPVSGRHHQHVHDGGGGSARLRDRSGAAQLDSVGLFEPDLILDTVTPLVTATLDGVNTCLVVCANGIDAFAHTVGLGSVQDSLSDGCLAAAAAAFDRHLRSSLALGAAVSISISALAAVPSGRDKHSFIDFFNERHPPRSNAGDAADGAESLAVVEVDDEAGAWARGATWYPCAAANAATSAAAPSSNADYVSPCAEAIGHVANRYERLLRRSSSAAPTGDAPPRDDRNSRSSTGRNGIGSASVDGARIPALVIRFQVSSISNSGADGAAAAAGGGGGGNHLVSHFTLACVPPDHTAVAAITRLCAAAAEEVANRPLPRSAGAALQIWPPIAFESSLSAGAGAVDTMQRPQQRQVDGRPGLSTPPRQQQVASSSHASTPSYIHTHPLSALLSECIGGNCLSVCLAVFQAEGASISFASSCLLLDMAASFRSCHSTPTINNSSTRAMIRNWRAGGRRLAQSTAPTSNDAALAAMAAAAAAASAEAEEKLHSLQAELSDASADVGRLKEQVESERRSRAQLEAAFRDLAQQQQHQQLQADAGGGGGGAGEAEASQSPLAVQYDALLQASLDAALQDCDASVVRRRQLVHCILALRNALSSQTGAQGATTPAASAGAGATTAQLAAAPAASAPSFLDRLTGRTHTTSTGADNSSSNNSGTGAALLSIHTSADPSPSDVASVGVEQLNTIEVQLLSQMELNDSVGDGSSGRPVTDAAMAELTALRNLQHQDRQQPLPADAATLQSQLRQSRLLASSMRNQLVKARDALVAAREERALYRSQFSGPTLPGAEGEKETLVKAIRLLRSHLVRSNERSGALQGENERLRGALAEASQRMQAVAALQVHGAAADDFDAAGRRGSRSRSPSGNGRHVKAVLQQLHASEVRTVELLRDNAVLAAQGEGLRDQLKSLSSRYEASAARLRQEIEGLRSRLAEVGAQSLAFPKTAATAVPSLPVKFKPAPAPAAAGRVAGMVVMKPPASGAAAVYRAGADLLL